MSTIYLLIILQSSRQLGKLPLFRSPLDEVIGQKRAVQAITFGLEMASPGYNIS
jgi:hypothetical protein